MWEVMLTMNGGPLSDYGVVKAANIKQLIKLLSAQLGISDLTYPKDYSVKATTYEVCSGSRPNFFMVVTKYN